MINSECKICNNQLICLFLQKIEDMRRDLLIELLEMKRTNQIMDEIRKTMMPEMIIQTELSVSIANRIYECLEQRNMTQKDLARMMGKTETEVSRWLSGTHNFTIATIAKITKVLGEAIIQPTSSVVHSYMLPQQERSIYLSDPEA